MLNKIDAFMGCDSTYQEAKTVIFATPFDSTTSFRPGTRFAGKAIRADSFGVESYSPYQDKDIFDLQIFDCGDLELPLGNPVKSLDMIDDQAARIIADDKLPFMIGGEHLVTLGAIRAVAKKYPDLHVIHLDAHTDLRDDYLGEKLSHATVMRRVCDILGDKRIYQFGIRSGERSEFEFARAHTVMNRYNLEGFSQCVDALIGKPVYFSLDLDVLDPSVFPGTGTPEPGGISFADLMGAVHMLSRLNIVGCDVCELSPHYDHSGVSTAVACKIIREMLIVIQK